MRIAYNYTGSLKGFPGSEHPVIKASITNETSNKEVAELLKDDENEEYNQAVDEWFESYLYRLDSEGIWDHEAEDETFVYFDVLHPTEGNE